MDKEDRVFDMARVIITSQQTMANIVIHGVQTMVEMTGNEINRSSSRKWKVSIIASSEGEIGSGVIFVAMGDILAGVYTTIQAILRSAGVGIPTTNGTT